MIVLSDNKVNCSKKIESCSNPEFVYVPLEDNYGIYTCIKEIGDYVYKNDIIGKTEDNFYIHSPVSGKITEFQLKSNCSGKMVKVVKITNDMKEKIKTIKKEKQDKRLLSKKQLIDLLKENGIVGLSGNGFPTFIKYDHEYKYLIVNGMECEPYISCDNALMYQHAPELLECLDYLFEIMNFEKIYIAINDNNNKVINNFLKYINSYPHIKIYPIYNYYPNGWERNIIEDIFHLKYEKYPYEAGVLVSNVSTIYAIYEMLVFDIPLTSRIITISGEGVKTGVNVRVKIGDVLGDIINKHGKYKKNINNCLFITKGPMNGISHKNDDIIVTKDLNGVVILNNVDERVTTCIRCGKCLNVCPVKLKPVNIMNNISKPEKLSKMSASRCISCGLCSYICPAHIELREFVQKAKEKEK